MNIYLKVLVGAGAFLVLVGGAYFTWRVFNSSSEYNSSPTPPPQQEVVQDTRQTYSSSTLGYSLKYPQGYSVNDAYTYDQFEKKPIHGVKITIPLEMATGTNLSSDTGISVEQLPRAKNCTGDIYVLANVKALSVVEGGVTYSVATSSGAAAGNLYEEMVYAIASNASSTPCTAVRYFIHSTNIGNYEPGAVREFDRAALIRVFDEIRRSLSFQ